MTYPSVSSRSDWSRITQGVRGKPNKRGQRNNRCQNVSEMEVIRNKQTNRGKGEEKRNGPRWVRNFEVQSRAEKRVQKKKVMDRKSGTRTGLGNTEKQYRKGNSITNNVTQKYIDLHTPRSKEVNYCIIYLNT